MLEKYGPIYLERVEYERSLERWMKGYRRFLGRSLLRRRGNPFWDYRVAMLGNLGCSFSRLRLLGALLYDALRTVMSPFTAVGRTLAFGRPPARKP